MMDLSNKTLLLMGGGAFARDIKKYSDEKGFRMIAVGKGYHSPLTNIADEAYPIDTQDVESLVRVVREKNVDGIFVGAGEINISPAIEVSERTGAHFYATRALWDLLSDKQAFKDLLKKHGLPVIPEYEEGQAPESIKYPVIVKPVDGSGAVGITVCHKAEEQAQSITYAKEKAKSKRVIIEKFMQGLEDVFVRYHFQDGRYSVSSSFDKHSDFSKGGFTGMPLLYTHPSRHLKAYLEKFDGKMQALFHDIGIQNGVMTLQGFVDDEEDFYFYEAGYRLGGSQSYLFTDAVNQSNSLNYMINFALTGSMADYPIAERDNPYFTNACCNQYIPLKSGKLTQYKGLDAIKTLPGVLNVTEMCKTGTQIVEKGDLNQVCLRMHLMAENWDALDALLAQVDDTLSILDENGNDMQMRHIRCVADAM